MTLRRPSPLLLAALVSLLLLSTLSLSACQSTPQTAYALAWFGSPTPTYYQVPPDATATPTPFRPVGVGTPLPEIAWSVSALPATPTAAPVEPTAAPAEPTAAPVEPTAAPAEPTPAEPTASEPVASEPAASEPAASEPAASEPVTSEPVIVITPVEPEAAAPQPEAPKPAKKNKKNKNGAYNQPDGQINILLLGSDKRPGDPMFRTDTIMLATLNPQDGSINLTSFRRDLYITIPGYGTNRINTAFKLGGFELLAQTFRENFGVYPDNYVMINFWSFKQVVDSLGGLTVDVGQEVSDYRSGQWYTVKKGPQEMDADDVLWYSRSRKSTNDFARARRQQEVMRALFEKMITLEAVKRIPEFYTIYRDNVKTDISLPDILTLLPFAAQLTDSSHLHHYFIGPEQTYDWITYDGAMVLLPRPEAIQEIMMKALNLK